MTKSGRGTRRNQRYRTRQDLLRAAAELLKRGDVPTLEEVAQAARVSRATAYRYFRSIEALITEAPLDRKVPSAEQLFAADESSDPAKRLERADAALDEMIRANETQLRLMLAQSLEADGGSGEAPVRQNRRTPLIEAALAPARERLDDDSYRKLVAALALVLGTESTLVFRDVLDLDGKTARRVKSWAIRALVATALEESARRKMR